MVNCNEVAGSRGRGQQERLRHILVVLLTFNSGATDAIGYLALGGAFTSVMTGNIVLLGISTARLDAQLAEHTAAAVACYITGCLFGAWVAGTPSVDNPVWPSQVSRALAIELAALSVYAIGWWETGSQPSGAAQLALLAINAVALGVQSSAVQRFGVAGLSTTYMTGTLTMVVVRLASGRRGRDVVSGGQLLLGLIGGAAAGGFLATHARMLVPVVQLACLITVLLCSIRLTRPVSLKPVHRLASPHDSTL